jgi:hypothetical protein
LLLDMIPLVTIIVLAFAAGYGLRALVSYQRRQRWQSERRRVPRARSTSRLE